MKEDTMLGNNETKENVFLPKNTLVFESFKDLVIVNSEILDYSSDCLDIKYNNIINER